MNEKRYIRLCLCNTLGSFALFWLGISRILAKTDSPNLQSISKLYIFFFPMSLGFLLALPHAYKNIRSEGELVVDYLRLLFIGIPSFYAAIMPLAFFSPISKYLLLGSFIIRYTIVPFAAGVTFSYVIITSISKQGPKIR